MEGFKPTLFELNVGIFGPGIYVVIVFVLSLFLKHTDSSRPNKQFNLDLVIFLSQVGKSPVQPGDCNLPAVCDLFQTHTGHWVRPL